MSIKHIQFIARKAAIKGLKLCDAQALFDAMYDADALVLAKGNIAKAAEIAGINKAAFYRRRRRRKHDDTHS